MDCSTTAWSSAQYWFYLSFEDVPGPRPDRGRWSSPWPGGQRCRCIHTPVLSPVLGRSSTEEPTGGWDRIPYAHTKPAAAEPSDPPRSPARQRHRQGLSGSARCSLATGCGSTQGRSLWLRWLGSWGDRKDGEEVGEGFLRWKITSVRAPASLWSRLVGGWGAGYARLEDRALPPAAPGAHRTLLAGSGAHAGHLCRWELRALPRAQAMVAKQRIRMANEKHSKNITQRGNVAKTLVRWRRRRCRASRASWARSGAEPSGAGRGGARQAGCGLKTCPRSSSAPGPPLLTRGQSGFRVLSSGRCGTSRCCLQHERRGLCLVMTLLGWLMGLPWEREFNRCL